MQMIVRAMKSRFVLEMLTLAFWAALASTFVGALLPSTYVAHISRWDKLEHFLAFVVLTTLGSVAFPRRSAISIAAALSLFGALIELAQGLPMIGRDADVFDWLADTLAIAATFAIIAAVRWTDWPFKRR